jgi:hypothetical protein
MFRDVWSKAARIRNVPAVIFVVVGGAMNLKYAGTLGTGEIEQWIFRAFAVGITLYSVLGWDMVLENARNRDYAKSFAAAVLLAGCLVYDGASAYGFNVREQTLASTEGNRLTGNRKATEADIARKESEREPYNSAPALEVAQQRVDTLSAGLNPATCRAKRLSEETQRRCTDLEKARDDLARSQAKDRLNGEVEALRTKLNGLPEAPPDDARKEVLGEFLTRWLPVIVIMGGSALSFFVVPPRRTEADTSRSVQPESQATAPQKMAPAGRPEVSASADVSTIVAKLILLTQRPDEISSPRVTVDSLGWIRGPQRRLADELDIPTTRLSRALTAGKRAGLLDVDTTNGTAVRVRPEALMTMKSGEARGLPN